MARQKVKSKIEYSFCEGSRATSTSPWHLRRLTEKGMKLGGGIDAASLCGRITPPWGWDLKVTITAFHLEKNTCMHCKEIYLQETRKP